MLHRPPSQNTEKERIFFRETTEVRWTFKPKAQAGNLVCYSPDVVKTMNGPEITSQNGRAKGKVPATPKCKEVYGDV